MQTTAYVYNVEYATDNTRPGVFLSAPANLETQRAAGKVITISLSEGITAEQFNRGVADITMQIALSPVTDVIGEVIINSAG